MRKRTVVIVCVGVACIILGIYAIEDLNVREKANDVPLSTAPSTSTVSPPSTPSTDLTAIFLPAEDLTITIVYDNNPYDPNLVTDWGFSCLIEGCEKTILFDTGGDGNILMSNMQELGVNPRKIDVVFFSHFHGDHTFGLSAFLNQNSDVTVYALQTFPSRLLERVREYGAELILVSEPVEICKDVYSTGLMGPVVDEQSLIIRTDKGLIVITGCAHPGIVRIVKKAKELFQDDVLFVMGGFHLVNTKRSDIEAIVSYLKELGVLYAGPCHCSGNTAREVFKEEYGRYFIDIGVGRIIYVKALV